MDHSSPEASDPLMQTQADMANCLIVRPVSSDPGFYPSESSKYTDLIKQRFRRSLPVGTEEFGRAKKMLKDGNQTNEEQSSLAGLINEKVLIKGEYERLVNEIRQLKDEMAFLQFKSLPTAQELKKADSCYSQSTTQCHGSNRLPVQIATQNIISSDQGAASAAIPYDSASITELLMKIDADDKSNVNMNDFAADLSNEELVTCGNHSVPRSLCSTAVRINNAYGDITAKSKMNAKIVGMVYTYFCAVIKEMDDLELEQITESEILKWRDVIMDALRIDLDAGFAMVHLRKITQAYVGLKFRQQLKSVDVSITKLEAALSAKKGERAKLLEQSQLYSDSIEVFSCKSVSAGLFSQHS